MEKKKRKIKNKSILFVIILMAVLLINLNLVFTQTSDPTQITPQPTPPFNQQNQQLNQQQQTFGGSSQQGGSSNSQPSRNIQFTNPSFSGGSFGGGGFGSSGLGGGGGLGGFGGGRGFGFDPAMCLNRQDFIVHIAPEGCSPALVRSDLLEEQSVPVFCKLTSFQINPLLSGTRIRSLRIKGKAPEGVQGISYIPSRSALLQNRFGRGFGGGGFGGSGVGGLGGRGNLGVGGFGSRSSLGGRGSGSSSFGQSSYFGRDFVSSPVNDDMGYLVVVVSQRFNESLMPDFIEGNITVVMDYDSSGVFGVGNTNFYLGEMSEGEWQADYRGYSLWNGKAYVRAEAVESDRATISIYRDQNLRESSVTLMKGETSRDIHLGGLYCSAGMRIRLESIEAPLESALLQINDQQIWVSRGDRIINNRCTVNNLVSSGSGGKVTINCPGNRFDLSLGAGKTKLEVDGSSKEVAINEKVKENIDGTNIYLGYIGRDSDGKDFVILVDDPISKTKLEFADKEVFRAIERVANKNDGGEVLTELKTHYKKRVDKEKQKEIDKIKVITLRVGDSKDKDSGIRLLESSVAKDRNLEDPEDPNYNIDAKRYYDLAIKNYQDLFELYSHEKSSLGGDPLAAEGLFEAYQLSRKFGMNKQASKFLNELITNYPESSYAEKSKHERNLLFRYDKTNSKKVVEIDRMGYSIDILEFKKPSKKQASAVFLIKGEETTLGLNEFKKVDDVNIQLTKIDTDKVDINYEYIDKDSKKVSKKETLTLGEKSQTKIKNFDIKLKGINIEKQAKITITPIAYGTRTEASFNLKIGIEKRLIQLTPERTKTIMDNLNKAIKDWNEINAKLGKVIKGLKAACFATSAVLTVKNLFEGSTGASMARNKIMTAPGGWNEKCEELVSQERATTLQQCLLKHNKDINEDVRLYSEQLQATNAELKIIQKDVGIERTDFLDFEGQTDSKAVNDKFRDTTFKEFCGKNKEGNIALPGAEKRLESLSDMCKWSAMTHEQRREIMTLYKLKGQGSGVLKGFVNRELGRVTLEAKNLHTAKIARQITIENNKLHGLDLKTTNLLNDRITYAHIKTISSGESINHQVYKNMLREGAKVMRIYIPQSKAIGGTDKPFEAGPEVGGKEILIPLVEVKGQPGTFTPDPNAPIYYADGRTASEDAEEKVREYLGLSGVTRVKEASFKSYQNQMVNPERLIVKYFERAPYRGMPSLIPFDIDEGWYVQINYVLSGFGQPYDQSGRVTNFYICNVGPNGEIEFKKSGDDICRYYNGHSSEISFPGMTTSESSLLVQKAQQAIQEASRQYGQQRVTIGKNSFASGTSFDTGDGQCTDFMAPADCNIMFNVCDPVICPSSRCDLGGRFRVDNVIQTGIIGSLALCLPNAQEGIAIPICLTGVHAGLDNYISILNSTAACLNESLATGRNIGICDEIKSVYMCDFFWRQATPFMSVLLERSFELVLGQGVRGGGEYLTARHAFANTRGAVDFFKNQYAVNSIRAFQGRTLDTIGGSVQAQVCKSFISTGAVGALGSAFESLIEPDSPEQYSAWFSENQLTTATLPPTSHYKVYYHIYAGKDIGAFYSIYLKDVPITPGIASTGVFVVDRGYIERGSQVDRAKDFTAISGFKQLCVNINGREECGFGKVSTSYAINAISDAYAKEQVEQTNIISEKQCIAGTPSLYSLAQPNLQAGLESTINPQLYNQGITRICATENPGKQVSSSGQYDKTASTYDRWKEVGYCDDRTIKCWLDTRSVKQIIRDKGIEKQVLDQVDLNILGEDNYMTPYQGDEILNEAKRLIDNPPKRENIIERTAEIIIKLGRLTNLGANNRYRARAFLSLGTLNKNIAMALIKPDKGGDTGGTTTDTTGTTPPAAPEEDKKQEVPGPPDSVPKTETTKKELEEGAAIIINNPKPKDVPLKDPQTRFSYRYTSIEGWKGTDKDFNAKAKEEKYSYDGGINIIVNKLKVGGEICVKNCTKGLIRRERTKGESNADIITDIKAHLRGENN